MLRHGVALVLPLAAFSNAVRVLDQALYVLLNDSAAEWAIWKPGRVAETDAATLQLLKNIAALAVPVILVVVHVLRVFL
jgi:hypothetical protein